jgi:ComF family protein
VADVVALRTLLDRLFPSRCLGCRRVGGVFCPACRPRPEASRRLPGGGLAVVAAGRYAGILRRAILLYKRGRRDAGDELAALLADRVVSSLEADALLVPVPTTASRRRARGFDHSLNLARELGRRAGRPVVVALVQVAGDAQRGRSRRARLAASGRFACCAPALVAGTRIVLVDDVLTTGATLRDCARTLERSGATVTGAVVLAYA